MVKVIVKILNFFFFDLSDFNYRGKKLSILSTIILITNKFSYFSADSQLNKIRKNSTTTQRRHDKISQNNRNHKAFDAEWVLSIFITSEKYLVEIF